MNRETGEIVEKIERKMNRYCRRDWLIAVALTAVMLILGGCSLTYGMPSWGHDDFAAYISEGIAISEGRLEEQTRLNYTLHPSELPDEASPDGLMYVWGYPLMLSAVHRLVGFDMENYSDVIWYKLPSLICFALMAGVVYLFFRRRLGMGISAVMVLLFSAGADFFVMLNWMYSDHVFLFFSTLTLLMAEWFVNGHRERPSIGLAVALGAMLWYTWEVRLNGSSLLVVLVILQAVWLMGRRGRIRLGDVMVHVLPYAVFLALKLASEQILPSATSNMSDVGSIDLDTLLYNIYHYAVLSFKFLNELTGGFEFFLGVPLSLLFVIGFFAEGFRRENLHLTVLIAGTYLVLLSLPYMQGMRYLYNILPILLLYAVLGGRWMIRMIARGVCRKTTAAMSAIGWTLAAAMILMAYSDIVPTCVSNLQNGRMVSGMDVYSPASVEMFRYVRENTEEDCVIAFRSPRALYLNTGRMGFCAGINGHELMDADYCLDMARWDSVHEKPNEEDFELIFSNDGFRLYRILGEGME